MTQQVDFYINKDPAPQSVLRTACRITEKALFAGHRVHIRAQNEHECEALNTMLWTFRDRSFVPHEISPVPLADCPVTISAEKSPDIAFGHTDTLVNIALELPDNVKQFQRIIEIVGAQEEALRAGREHYRFYHENGLELHHHEVPSA